MKRFIFLVLVIFGFLLSYQTLRIMNQQRYMSSINVNQFKDKLLKVVSPEIFAEKNIFDTFQLRYKASLKYIFQKNEDKYLDLINDDLKSANVIIYPSFVYDELKKKGDIFKLDEQKIPNIKNLKENFVNLIKMNYHNDAVPVAYIPYALFFDSQKIKPSTLAKELLQPNFKIAIPSNYGAFLALCKMLKLDVSEKSVKTIKDYFSKGGIFFYDENDLEKALEIFQNIKPQIILAPVYLKAFFERRIGTIEMVLPDEGTFATLYLISIINSNENELANIYINHLTDPLIHKNLSDVFNIPITNKVSLKTMAPVLYNSLKMNDDNYFSKLYILKSSKEYKNINTFYEAFKKATE